MKEHYILQFPFTSAAGDVINTLQLGDAANLLI